MPNTIKEVYRLVEKWCNENKGTGSTECLMRLILSLYNGRAWSFSLPVVVWSLGGERLDWAKAIIADYFERGESRELCALARKFAEEIDTFVWPPLEEKLSIDRRRLKAEIEFALKAIPETSLPALSEFCSLLGKDKKLLLE